MKTLINYLVKLQNILLPATCVLCGGVAKRDIDLCVACEAELPWVQTFTATLALFHYEKPIDHLITAFKFQQQLVYGRLLGELLLRRIREWYAHDDLPEYIIPVPLHTQRLRERGFNQALELARPIAKQLNIKIDVTSCKRVIATPAQSNLPAVQRQRNVKDAFSIQSTLHAKHVAVIDDVITTGCTITELSRKLRETGIERIDVWCCARTRLSEG